MAIGCIYYISSITLRNSSMRDEDERLLDMVEAIERIEKYASEGRKSLSQMS